MAFVKSNYNYANSFRATRANLGYISREKTSEGERAKLYNEFGEELHRSDIKGVKEEMENSEMTRKIVLSPNPNTNMSQQEIKEYTRNTLEEYKHQSGKNFSYVYACHDNTKVPHSHVIAYGNKGEMYLDKKGYDHLKGIANEKEKEYSSGKELGKLKSLQMGSEKINQSLEKGEREAERTEEMELEM